MKVSIMIGLKSLSFSLLETTCN